MANHFKEYKNNINRNKNTVLSEEEITFYGKTSGNTGISHSHPEWDVRKVPAEDSDRDEFDSEKNKTILRDRERESKNRIGEDVSEVCSR